MVLQWGSLTSSGIASIGDGFGRVWTLLGEVLTGCLGLLASDRDLAGTDVVSAAVTGLTVPFTEALLDPAEGSNPQGHTMNAKSISILLHSFDLDAIPIANLINRCAGYLSTSLDISTVSHADKPTKHPARVRRSNGWRVMLAMHLTST